jgi:hypothetical protein
LNNFLGDLVESNIILLDTALYSLYYCLNAKDMIHMEIHNGSVVIRQEFMITEQRVAPLLEFFYTLDEEMIDSYYTIIKAKTKDNVSYNTNDILSTAGAFIFAMNKSL